MHQFFGKLVTEKACGGQGSASHSFSENSPALNNLVFDSD
jgi:hypothetical protein